MDLPIGLLQVTRGVGGRPVLAGLDLALAPGVLSLVGAPASGKTLLAGVALGWIPPEAGRVQRRVARVGWVPTVSPPFPGRLGAWHAAARATAGTWDEGIWRVVVGDLADRRLGRDLDPTQRALVALGVAAAGSPAVVWLDDPWRELDAAGAEALRAAFAKVRERHDAAYVVAGRADFPGADRFAELDGGRVREATR